MSRSTRKHNYIRYATGRINEWKEMLHRYNRRRARLMIKSGKTPYTKDKTLEQIDRDFGKMYISRSGYLAWKPKWMKYKFGK